MRVPKRKHDVAIVRAVIRMILAEPIVFVNVADIAERLGIDSEVVREIIRIYPFSALPPRRRKTFKKKVQKSLMTPALAKPKPKPVARTKRQSVEPRLTMRSYLKAEAFARLEQIEYTPGMTVSLIAARASCSYHRAKEWLSQKLAEPSEDNQPHTTRR